MYLTIAERSRREAHRRALAVTAIAAELAAYARVRGGRFLLYGSAARGDIRADSDVDVLMDFPEPLEAEAWRRAEEVCWRHEMRPDIRPLRRCDERFRSRVLPTAKALA